MSKSVCQRNCDQCRMQAYCQGCSICEMPFCRKDCDRCFSLCPDHAASFAQLRHVGGGSIALKENRSQELPYMIPVIPDRLTEKMTFDCDVIGIHGANFFSSNGENIARLYRRNLRQKHSVQSRQENFLFPETMLMIISFTAKIRSYLQKTLRQRQLHRFRMSMKMS